MQSQLPHIPTSPICVALQAPTAQAFGDLPVCALSHSKCLAEKSMLPVTAYMMSSQIPLHGGPWYCVQKDTRMNTVYVSRQYFSEDKTRDRFRCARTIFMVQG